MTVFVIVLLLVLGIVLLLLEFLVVPGVTIAGIGGVIMMGGGIYLAYTTYGSMVGHITLFSVLVVNIVIMVYALKSRTWKKFMLDSKVDSSVETDTPVINVGDTGICVTRLAPMGKVRVGDLVVEGQSIEGYLDAKTNVEVVKVYKYKIIVKPKKD
jgi:membrane-bound ClpP family serine protease